ncbi:MAG: hypothetical protein K6D91_02815 [Prevotella sp.]|nr:hypothetical protein [Prevotella sp.]
MKRLFLIFFSFVCAYANADGAIKITKEMAWKIVKCDVLKNDVKNINVYVFDSVMYANSIVETLSTSEITPNAHSWLFFIDDLPAANWSHPCRYIYVDCNTGRIISHSHSMPPSNILLRLLTENQKDSERLPVDIRKRVKMQSRSIVYNNDLKNYAYNNNYAVIISGGASVGNNYQRYWNDCSSIYSTLINVYGYNKNHIYVIMADGTDSAFDRLTDQGYDSSPLDLDGDGLDDIQYAATRSNIQNVFNQLANTLTTDNNLFVFTMDHGTKRMSNSCLCLWYDEMLDFEFADLLSTIHARSLNLCMGQCFSGGFIDDLTNEKYVISTACKDNESSYSLNMGFGGYDAYVYYWTAAVSGFFPNGTIANADLNNDGFVSMKEAFVFANMMDSTGEHPQLSSTPLGTDSRLNLFMEIPDIIHGDAVVAMNGDYSIPNLPSGLTVRWSISNSNLVLLSGQGTSTANFKKAGDGSCIISADIFVGATHLCSLSKDVWCGVPSQPQILDWPNKLNPNSVYGVTARQPSEQGVNQYQWTLQGGTIVGPSTGPSVMFRTSRPGTDVILTVRAKNDCGWGNVSSKAGRVKDGSSVVTSTGSGKTINITMPEPGSYEIQLWSKSGLLRKETTDLQQYTININTLPSDIYFVRVLKDGEVVQQSKFLK